MMDYVFSNAAVARSFTAYLGTAIGVATTERWRITVTGLPEGFNQIDFLALGVILVISLCICYRFLSAETFAFFFHLTTARPLFFPIFSLLPPTSALILSLSAAANS